MKLTEGERMHPLWRKIEAHLNERLTTLRAQNDKVVSEQITADTRGRIAAVKDLLMIGIEPPGT